MLPHSSSVDYQHLTSVESIVHSCLRAHHTMLRVTLLFYFSSLRAS